MDLFDLLDDTPPAYSVSVWHYGTTRGIWAAGKTFPSLAEAEEALSEHVGKELTFENVSLDRDEHAGKMYRERREVALVSIKATIVAQAFLEAP